MITRTFRSGFFDLDHVYYINALDEKTPIRSLEHVGPSYLAGQYQQSSDELSMICPSGVFHLSVDHLYERFDQLIREKDLSPMSVPEITKFLKNVLSEKHISLDSATQSASFTLKELLTPEDYQRYQLDIDYALNHEGEAPVVVRPFGYIGDAASLLHYLNKSLIEELDSLPKSASIDHAHQLRTQFIKGQIISRFDKHSEAYFTHIFPNIDDSDISKVSKKVLMSCFLPTIVDKVYPSLMRSPYIEPYPFNQKTPLSVAVADVESVLKQLSHQDVTLQEMLHENSLFTQNDNNIELNKSTLYATRTIINQVFAELRNQIRLDIDHHKSKTPDCQASLTA